MTNTIKYLKDNQIRLNKKTYQGYFIGNIPPSFGFKEEYLGKDEDGLKYTLQEANRTVAIREGNWKFIPGKKNTQLYDLGTDIGEKVNLATKKPEIAKALAAKLAKLRSSKGLRHAEK